MSNLIADLEEIKQISERKRKQNYDFRSYMKGYLDWSDEELDSTVYWIYRKLSHLPYCI